MTDPGWEDARTAQLYDEIPIFANNLLAGMPHEQQIEVIDKAYEKVDRSVVGQSRWACFVARLA